VGPPRVVYEGTLSTNGGHYDLHEIFTRLVAEGVELHVYPSRDVPAYRTLADALADALADGSPGMTCHDMLPPRRLLAVLPDYDFGWAGFNASLNPDHLDTALPNTLFEYVGCGLPVLTFGHRALTRFLAQHGVGVTLANLDNLLAQLAELDLVALRRQVAAAREHLTMEANIGRVIALYDEVAGS
jgi:hypothetical protein